VHLLIDGYNLMHAAGYLTTRKTGRIEPIRQRFLAWLTNALPARNADAVVVFDGHAPRTASSFPRVTVRYSAPVSADDAIEAILSSRERLDAVVSNDARLHESARRANVPAWRCERFLDWLIEPPRRDSSSGPTDEKPTGGVEESDLLRAFQNPRGRRS
jgi:phosphoribosylpyrophosphate synthetase